MPLLEGPAVNFFTVESDAHEWDRPLDEILAELTGADVSPEDAEALLVPDRWGALTPAQWRVRELIAQQRWYLLRNVWNWKSSGRYGGRAGAVERYYTIGGKPTPFNGLSAIYAVLREAVGADEPDATDITRDAADGLWREAWKLGAIEPLERTRARYYALEIYTRTRGQVDLWPKAGTAPELVIVRR